MNASSANQLITMKTYLHFSVFKRLLHADVLTRILQAFGVDINSKNAMVSQEQFIAVNCFLRYGTMPRLMIIETWIKILDPYGYGKLPRHFYMDFFEKLARGKLTLISTIVSSSFAQ